jgi:uncharacterized protein YjbI with pentapeptide repeats
MTTSEPAYRQITQDEWSALAQAGGPFERLCFPADVTLDDIDAVDGTFTRCVFQCPTIRGADFSGVTFKDCVFGPTRFASCKFVGAKFTNGVFFEGTGKTGCIFAFCDLRSVEMDKCNLAVNSFERCDLYNLRAVDCSFRGVNFHGTSFHRAISKKVVLTKATFDRCNFSFADMSGLSLRGCELLSSKFIETALFDTDLSEAVMTGCVIDRAEWDGAKLRGTNLQGAAISGLNLARLADYAGLVVSADQQESLLRQLGVDVRPD